MRLATLELSVTSVVNRQAGTHVTLQQAPLPSRVGVLVVVVAATVGLAGCAGSASSVDAVATQAAGADEAGGSPLVPGSAAEVSALPSNGREFGSQPAAMQACTGLVTDGRSLAAPGGDPTVEVAYTVRLADLNAWWQQDGRGPLTKADGAALAEEGASVTICLIHADVVQAPGSPGMSEEYHWGLTAILADGTPRPLTASPTRPTDLPPDTEPDP